jgi:DNA-binding NarL/FixJ family response regulator
MTAEAAMRVVIADDNLLVREGITSLLRQGGLEVAGQADTGDELMRAVEEHDPDVVIVDIRMPPTHTDEGLVAAREIRARRPGIAIVILSQHVESGIATRVLAEHPARLGYLLKDRVIDIDDFLATLRRVAAGGTALDPQVVSRLLAAGTEDGPLERLTPREREVLQLIAEGWTNQAIAERTGITLRSTEKHVSSIFAKLELPDSGSEHRRVLAALRFLGL